MNRLLGEREAAEVRTNFLRGLGCVLSPHSATYVAMPITSGRRFIQWHRRSGKSLSGEAYNQGLLHEVEEPNKRRGHEYVIGLRARRQKHGGRPVIEPASLSVSGFDQSHYIALWTAVIEQFAAEVILLDGWQYSVGCSTEFSVAHLNSLAVTDEKGHSLEIADGAKLVAAAASELDATDGVTHARLHKVAAQIHKLGLNPPKTRSSFRAERRVAV